MLTVDKDLKREVLECFFDFNHDIGNTYSKGQGKPLGFNIQRRPRTDQVLSEYSEVRSFKELCDQTEHNEFEEGSELEK